MAGADPVVLLKLSFLQTHYNLSDREVIATAQVNATFPYVLKIDLATPLPPSSLDWRAGRISESLRGLWPGASG